jgi:hypothetical protein
MNLIGDGRAGLGEMLRVSREEATAQRGRAENAERERDARISAETVEGLPVCEDADTGTAAIRLEDLRAAFGPDAFCEHCGGGGKMPLPSLGKPKFHECPYCLGTGLAKRCPGEPTERIQAAIQRCCRLQVERAPEAAALPVTPSVMQARGEVQAAVYLRELLEQLLPDAVPASA